MRRSSAHRRLSLRRDPKHRYLTAFPWTANAILSIVLLLQGCSLPQRTFQPEPDPATLSDHVFLHYLATQPVITVDEGIRAVLLLDENPERWPTYERRYEELRDRNAIKSTWRLTPGRILDKGTLAHMLCTVCDLPQSLGEWLAAKTGLGDRRAALGTCVYEGILTGGLPHAPVTGGELLSAIVNSETHIATRRKAKPETHPNKP